MTNQQTMQIFERDNTITTSKLRSIGYVPATIYGKNVGPYSIQLKTHEFELAYNHGVREFQLTGMGLELTAEARQLQLDNTRGTVKHIEFVVKNHQEAPANKSAAKVEAQEPALAH